MYLVDAKRSLMNLYDLEYVSEYIYCIFSDHKFIFLLITTWGYCIVEFTRLVRNEACSKHSSKISQLENEINTNYTDIMEMFRLVEQYNKECDKLNKEVCAKLKECADLKNKNIELSKSLQHCKNQKSNLFHKYERLRRATASGRSIDNKKIYIDPSTPKNENIYAQSVESVYIDNTDMRRRKKPKSFL